MSSTGMRAMLYRARDGFNRREARTITLTRAMSALYLRTATDESGCAPAAPRRHRQAALCSSTLSFATPRFRDPLFTRKGLSMKRLLVCVLVMVSLAFATGHAA